MTADLLEIHPRELKFTFELKKQSSCSVRLANKSEHFVAFKVKTTSPKKYCVRPNVGVVKPKAVCDFAVTMQAQRVAPPDLICKDKFLIQSTVVPVGTTDDDITPSMFAKDGGTYIEECKLKVLLVLPDHSPNLSPIKGTLKQFPASEASEGKAQVLTELKVTSDHSVSKDLEEPKVVEDEELRLTRDVEEMKLVKDIQMMRSKLDDFESKLFEAEATITKLTLERKSNIKQREILQQELDALRHNKVVKRVQVGFPFLFVCMMAFISFMLGYYINA